MLCTLLSGAFRLGEGQLKITWLPCCAPESDSVRCCTRSTGGDGARRLPHPAKAVVSDAVMIKALSRLKEKLVLRVRWSCEVFTGYTGSSPDLLQFQKACSRHTW